MFMNMATAEPLPGQRTELLKRMKTFADALRLMPGLVNVFVLTEEGTENLIGLSIWTDQASFERGMASVPSLPDKVAVTKQPPIVRHFTEV